MSTLSFKIFRCIIIIRQTDRLSPIMALSLKGLRVVATFSRSALRKAIVRNHPFATMSELLDKVEDVDIETSGRFKYILINVEDPTAKANKVIVRGYALDYHGDVFDEANNRLKRSAPGLKMKCLGGGRIEHKPDEKTLKVYGYSQGYGKADHQVATDLLKKKYGNYDINFSNEGY